jgi:citrate synthase
MTAPHLTTAEVARRLGVKPATVYAYVSRGLLRSRRNADGKGSLFDPADVAAFAAERRRTTRSDATPAIHTGITLIARDGLSYRGHDAVELARSRPYEEVVSLLWTGSLVRTDLHSPPELRALAEAVTAALPATARLSDRLRVIVAAAAAADPMRFDTSPAAVVATAGTVLATMVDALPLRPGAVAPPPSARLADRLWPRLTATPATPAGSAALNAALVLLADHDIAASTLAARVAASIRAHPYAVVAAGLAAHDGPLHGGASGLAYRLLADATRSGDPVREISERLRTDGVVPGFGHRLYPDGDPRAAALLAMLPDAPPTAPVPADGGTGGRAAIDALLVAMDRRSKATPNVDFALAALALLTSMGPDAGETIFAVARTAGWIAHALEEYADAPSRFRPVGRYTAIDPGRNTPARTADRGFAPSGAFTAITFASSDVQDPPHRSTPGADTSTERHTDADRGSGR